MNRFVAFLDALAFSKYVENNTLERSKVALETLREIETYANRIPAMPGFPVLEGKFINSMVYSDSIVFYTDGSEKSDFCRLVHVVKIAVRSSLTTPTPLRGAISYGECHVEPDKGMIVGKGYLDACESEHKQLWAGAYVSDIAIDYVRSISDDCIKFLVDIGFLIEYSIPFKDAITKPTSNLAINWANPVINEDVAEAKELERKMFYGYPFCETLIHNEMQKIQPNTESDTNCNIDLSSFDAKIMETINNTREFYLSARDKGNSPFHHLD